MGLSYNEGELFLDLPNIEGLDEAVLLINKACSLKLKKTQTDCLDRFCAGQFQKIKKLIESEGLLDKVDIIKDVMKETAEYYKGRKSCLQAKDEK